MKNEWLETKLKDSKEKLEQIGWWLVGKAKLGNYGRQLGKGDVLICAEQGAITTETSGCTRCCVLHSKVKDTAQSF